MDIIEATRQLGLAIQADERFKKLVETRKINDDDTELQELIGQFNVARMSIDNELNKEDGKDEEKIKEFNQTLRELYGKIMINKSMVAFNEAKRDFEAVMNKVNGIIELCVMGEDPLTCQPSEGCTGSCSTCGGCH